MGPKEIMENEEHKDHVALTILLKSNAIKKCEYCDDYYDNLDEEALTNAYKIGNSMITKKDKLVDVFDGDRKTLSDRIKSVYSDTNWECHCEQVMKD